MADDARPGPLPEIDWTVIGVFDPAGQTPSFAYTVGLTDRGLPELHLWAQPSTGTDPGEDWAFNQRESAALLNRFARQLIDGRLAPGDTWTDEMDFGLAEVTFTVGAPLAPGQVEAHQAAPDATVLPIRFALRRAPLRDGGEVDEVAAATIRGWTADLIAALTTAADLPPAAGALLPAEPLDTSADQTYGPATPLVVTLRAAVRTAGPGQLADVAVLGMLLETGSPLPARQVLGATAAFARVVGRDDAATAARTAAADDVRAALADPEVDAALLELMGESPASPEVDRARHALSSLLVHVLAAAYTAAATVDVLRPDVLTAGLAPVLTATVDGGLPRLWFDEPAQAAARARLGSLSAAQLRRLAGALTDRVHEREAVLTSALAAGADCPPVEQLLAGTGTLAAAWALGDGDADELADLLALLADLARAVAHPQVPGAAALLAALPD